MKATDIGVGDQFVDNGQVQWKVIGTPVRMDRDGKKVVRVHVRFQDGCDRYRYFGIDDDVPLIPFQWGAK